MYLASIELLNNKIVLKQGVSDRIDRDLETTDNSETLYRLLLSEHTTIQRGRT